MPIGKIWPRVLNIWNSYTSITFKTQNYCPATILCHLLYICIFLKWWNQHIFLLLLQVFFTNCLKVRGVSPSREMTETYNCINSLVKLHHKCTSCQVMGYVSNTTHRLGVRLKSLLKYSPWLNKTEAELNHSCQSRNS